MTALKTAEATTERFRRAGESGDVDLAMSTFSADAVVRSPLTERVRFSGHTELRALLEVAYGHLDDVSFHTDVGDERTRVVIYTAKIGGTELEEATLIRLDEQGMITEATLFVRPLPGLVEMMNAFGPAIARQGGRRGVGSLLAALTKPLLAMVRGGDRFAVPLAAPKR
jgi:SnoaL-like domain